ncbi:hypothetical protein CTAYLR_001408 [Chrysophaeum taylorii]|uniref:Tyrosine-specific transport protein n=1 Tax=Chrysophaeum taylorii TaxID=2483200 RepID=A0AAD7XIB5_9STRA|nr:hypothetical protein CTAYLR_001408 [Chrysophaeum taylorii]
MTWRGLVVAAIACKLGEATPRRGRGAAIGTRGGRAPPILTPPPRTKKKGALSAALLVAGTTIGAGILALPSVTHASGLVPSSVTLGVAWAFASMAGLLIAEATQAVSPARPLGFVATMGEVLGPVPKLIATAAFGFVCYSLMVAYVAEGGALCAPPRTFGVPPPALFATALGALLEFGSPALIDASNNVFVALVVAAFAAIIAVGAPTIVPARFSRANWSAAPRALPICVLSLVYHTVVPYVVDKLDGDPRLVATALLGGSAVPLAMFLVWNAVVIGAVAADATSIANPLAALRATTNSPALGAAVQIFSQFAIITSAIGLFFGLQSFISDICDVGPADQQTPRQHLCVTLGVLAPPLFFAIVEPNAFMVALDLAGTFGITTLFGLFPALAVWKLRASPSHNPVIKAPGGRATLLLQLALAAFMIGDGLARRLPFSS